LENPIRTMALPAAVGDATTTWDGKDDSGKIVAPGVYLLYIEAEGTGGTARSLIGVVTVFGVQLEKEDPDYPSASVPLRYEDYYPSLGDKIIKIKAEPTNALSGIKVTCEVVSPAAGVVIKVGDQIASETVFDAKGMAAFKLSAPQLTPENGPIQLKFTLLKQADDEKVGEISGTWNIKNNSNVTLSEVLDGRAVFVYDSDTSNMNKGNHKGVTGAGVTDDGQRRFDFAQELLNQVVPRKRSVEGYSLIDEDGIYYNATQAAVRTFKDNFHVSNQTINAGVNSLNKLMHDYDKTASDWADRIIDKETLVGVAQRAQDNKINTAADGDTGLYELYSNVVKVFVDAMIYEAQRYADFNEKTWYGRGGTVEQGPNVEDGQGVSYCFGCKDDLATFSGHVSSCDNNPDTGDAPDDYRGGVSDETCEVVKTDALQYPGLFSDEYNANSHNQPYYPTYWAGIDCSGFIQRLMLHSKNEYETDLALRIDVNDLIFNHETDVVSGAIGSQNFFVDNRAFDFSRQDQLKKGDLVEYSHHISMVYSDRWGGKQSWW
jgi:hypothetical protein